MKLKFKFTPLFASLLLAVGIAHADTITLKSGEKLEGKVVNETDTEVILEYNLTPKIKDKKTIQKADIQEMIRLSPSQLAFAEQKLGEVLPTPDLMTGGDYERIIQDKLRTFAAKFPGTPEAAEVEKMITTLSEEKNKVVNGQIKVQGEWLDAAAAKREAYNIEAYRVRTEMKAAMQGTDEKRYREALRLFDKLRTQYGASTQYVDAIPEALEILTAYQKQLSVMVAEHPVIAKQRADGLKTLTGADLSLTKSSIDQEEKAFKSTIEAQTKQKVKWRDVYKYDIKSIQSAMDTVNKEAATLKATDVAALRSENEALSAVLGNILDEKPVEAEAGIEKLRELKGSMVNKTEMARAEKELRLLKERIKAQQKAGGAMAVAAATGADETPSANPIEEAMRQREKEKQEKASGKTSASSGKDKKSSESDDKKETKGDKKTTKAKDSSSEKPKAAASSTPEPEPGMLAQINDYIPYIGGGLLLVLIVAMVLGKKKKADA